MTPTELFLIKLLKEAEQTLEAAQKRFPIEGKYDSIVSSIARQRGQIIGATNFVLKTEADKVNAIADLLLQNVSEL